MVHNDCENVLVKGAIGPQYIAETIAKLQAEPQIGAHDIFLGQIRADTIEGKEVVAIEYSAYPEMANKLFNEIGEAAIGRYDLKSIIICHSIGIVRTGEICLMVLASAKHRKSVFEGLRYTVEEIKKKVPVFGKEILEDNNYKWKVNN